LGTEADVELGLREIGLASRAIAFKGQIAQGHRPAFWCLRTCWTDKMHSPLCPPVSFNKEAFVLIAEADAQIWLISNRKQGELAVSLIWPDTFLEKKQHLQTC